MTYRRPAPPSPFNHFTRPGLPDDRPAPPYERESYLADADDARQRHTTLRAAGITISEIEALAIAVGRSVGQPEEFALIAMLRRLAPRHDLLRRLDRIAQELGYGYCGAGIEEQSFGADEFAAGCGRQLNARVETET